MKLALALSVPVAVLGGASAHAIDAPVLTDTAWTAAPSFTDVAAAYPAKAKAKGQAGEVLLDCTLTGTGRIGRCSTVSETPGGIGFSQAARSLIGRFQGPTELASGRTVAGVHAQIAFKFTPDLLETQTVTRPEWVMMPAPAAFQTAFPDAASKAGVLKARAVMNCQVAEGGTLSDCRSVSEEPAGYGFGAATLPLAPAFRLNAWGADGRPVIGGQVRVPIRYDLQQAPQGAGKP